MCKLVWRTQEIQLDHPDSNNRFEPGPNKQLVATPAALERFGIEVLSDCLCRLQQQAKQHDGLDYLQVFEDPATKDRLWFIEDGEGGAITALLPSDY